MLAEGTAGGCGEEPTRNQASPPPTNSTPAAMPPNRGRLDLLAAGADTIAAGDETGRCGMAGGASATGGRPGAPTMVVCTIVASLSAAASSATAGAAAACSASAKAAADGKRSSGRFAIARAPRRRRRRRRGHRELGGRRRLGVQRLVHDRGHAALERPLAGQQLIQQHAGGIDVGARVDRPGP